ncbi:MAG: anti-sigma factor domain-containing protein, partial [Clostridia bacterium]|nr:anti-sigma factor domain-containing protein [Clostridia bacterium]
MKGIIIEKGSGKSIVMDRSGRFIKARTMKGWREGDEVNFTPDSARTAGVLSLAAAFVITAALGLFGAFALNSYTVNLDVNPSISIEANAFNVVREITAMNDDAEQVGDLSALIGMKVGRAVNEAILILLEEGYLQADGTVVLSIEGSNNKVRTVVREVSDAIENAFVESQDGSETGDPDTGGVRIYVGRITEEMAAAAEELGVPYGRVVLAAKAVEEGAEMDYEMVSLLSIQEIQRIRNISKTIDKAADILEGTSKSSKEDGKAKIKQVEAMSDKILDEA